MITTYDAIVVGSGPSGCRTAQIIADNGYKVLIIEEHSEAGVPTQCTGFVSEKIGKIPDNIIVNKISNAKFFSSNSHFEVKSGKPMRLMDRHAFDKYVYGQAIESGAESKFNTRFTGCERMNEGILVNTSKGRYETKILVGADGPNSSVAKSAGLKPPNNILFLVQVRARGNFDSGAAELWFGSDVAPGNFAWVVPENTKIARVGLMAKQHPTKFFEKFFLRRMGYHLSDSSGKVSDRLGDTIRFGLIEKSVADGILLVGDAASQVKPFSAGGIVYGQIGARYAGNAVVEALERDDYSEKFLLENYEKKWKSELGKGIRRGLMFKRVFEGIQDRPMLFSIINKTGLVKFAEFFDADFIGKD